jgi:hypothetical protein
MNLSQALQVCVRTHVAALASNSRASAVAFVSGPGIGKSETVSQVCMYLARAVSKPVGLVTEMLATIQSVDVRGFMLPTKSVTGGLDTIFSTPPWYPTRLNTKVFMPDGGIHERGSYDGSIPDIGVVFLDEFGQAEDDVKKAAAELVLKGEVGNTRLPVGWRVITASNRMSDRSGVVRSLTFITNRRMEINIDAHLGTWNTWVNDLPVAQQPHYLTVSFANKSPELVFRDAVPPGDAPFCTPRTLVLMDRDLRALRSREEIEKNILPMDAVAREVCAGWIGGGESAQFMTHAKFADMIPDIADIERDPMRAKLPERADAQMVVAFMIAHGLSKTNGAKIITYMGRLAMDKQLLAALTIRKSQERSSFVANVPEFTRWLEKNMDTLRAAYE